MTAGLPPLDDDEAMREVGWIAREARLLIETPIGSENVERTATFYRRKARLLAYMNEPTLAARAESQAAAYEAGGAFYREPDPAAGPVCGCGHRYAVHLSIHSSGGCVECDCGTARPSWA